MKDLGLCWYEDTERYERTYEVDITGNTRPVRGPLR